MISNAVAILPTNYQPGPKTILIGKGNICTKATGNRRLVVLTQTYRDQYSQARTKNAKTVIVSKILDVIKTSCRSDYPFVKLHEGIWYEMDETTGRTKIGSLFRDSLSSKYKSSTKLRVERRRAMKQLAKTGSSSSMSSDDGETDQQESQGRKDSGVDTTAEIPTTFLSRRVSISQPSRSIVKRLSSTLSSACRRRSSLTKQRRSSIRRSQTGDLEELIGQSFDFAEVASSEFFMNTDFDDGYMVSEDENDAKVDTVAV